MKFLFVISLVLLALASLHKADSNADLVNVRVERTLDLNTHLAHILHAITVENKATSGSLKSYTFTVEPSLSKNVAFIGARLQAEKGSNLDAESRRLNVVTLSQDSNRGTLYRVDFRNELSAGKQLNFEVELVLFDLLRPYPTEIAQNDKQLVIFKSNLYYYSLYPTKSQTTIVNLGSDKVESYTQLKPTLKSDSSITYGPYENVKPFEQSELSVHFENNAPFLNVNSLQRTIEISHWGNVAVEETIDLYHNGAKLKGPFSRFDYMRKQGGSSSVKALKTLLPATAADVYYRDEIGNISTSNLRAASKKNDFAELEIRPRFPLFGGWKTHYTVGYNVPAYQYLFTKGNDYVLRMKLVDHLYDDQFVEEAVVKVILPEFSTNIEVITPYTVERRPNEMHYTYLDTVGRPVVVMRLKNVVDNHIQNFQVKYKFQKVMILQEPLLVVAFFFILFFVVIVLVRIDFSLTHRDHQHQHQKKE